ncbi:ADP-ribose pyrophosphatase YjhB, NUDIX family [Rhizobium sp. NFR07]|jgi:8-oxo-dGTP diphosphatase|uniref:NUDIX hydrolase n=1 Tax=Rhizobium sp. NFR07 TaxID=1566262 RepID=UPI0008EA62E2|nr:NUDIX domain-containing protein [Rhizobium sp. NFR07]SFB62488.1 ADP-ribose pyrophosphatase YjhB, NUDIX family [Rhizobium sp. NFR07]
MSRLVCAIFIDGDKALLVRRAQHRKWSPGKWDLVGGHAEKGEGLDIALVRECKEEVGLTPLAFNQVATLYEADDKKQGSPFHIYVVRQWTGGSAELLGHEHSELGWFIVDMINVLELAMQGYREVLIKSLR